MEYKFPTAGCRIDVLCQAFEANAPFLKIGHSGNEVGQGSAQTVEAPDY